MLSSPRHWAAITALAAAWAVLAPRAGAQETAGTAMFVTVANPITSEAAERLKNQISYRTQDARGGGRAQTVVFDFTPDGRPAATANFGPCYDLAKFIGSLKGRVNTIAYLRAPAAGHTVLPVLACGELVMAKAATLGPVVTEGVSPPDEVMRAAYRQVFNRDDRWPIVQKMFDPSVALVKGKAKAGGAARYANAADPESLKLVAGPEPVKGVQDNQLASYPPDRARDVELANGAAEDQRELAELYGLPPLRPDPLLGRTPEAYQWTLRGDVDGAMRESVTRVVRDVRKKKGNVLILVLQCGGTDLEAARGLAEDLAKAQEGDDAVQVIGFVPESAPDAAAVVALGCSEVVMSRAKDGEGKEAEFGNFDRFLKSTKEAQRRAQRDSVRDLAERRGYPGVLIDGMFDPQLEIVRARGKGTDRNKTKLMTREQFDAAVKAGEPWAQDKVVKPKGVPFRPNATLAAELGLSKATVPGTGVKDVTAAYGYGEAKSPDPGVLDRFAEFLRVPAVTIILVMIGFIGLILELKVPGLTVPGIVAALCFILVFWSQSRFSGEMFVLALLLFLLGLVLVGLEIFVLPGFGVCGISGILFMLAGLGLVTLERVPQNTAEWVGFGERLAYYLFAMMGALVGAFVIARFLPQVPYANRMMLTPPGDEPAAAESQLPGASAAAGLLGAIGTTTTALRPAGVVRFGEQFVDVVSDGGFIPAGTRVHVIAVEGTRIVVKDV
ncbi:MAG: NfeD family protein [Gemmata sp.]